MEIIKLLECVVKPTVKLKSKVDENSKHKKWTITIDDSVQSFIVECISIAELESVVQAKIEKYRNYKITLQPFILRLEDNEERYGIYLDGKYYLFKYLFSTLDYCFKTFFVFDLKYPVECDLIWKFFDSHIFEKKLNRLLYRSFLI